MAYNKSFSFKTIQKRYFNTELKNGKTLLVGMPKKAVFERMTELQEMQEEKNNREAYNEMCALMAEILRNNKQGYKVSAQDIKEGYELEEIIQYFRAYGKFVNSLAEEKN